MLFRKSNKLLTPKEHAGEKTKEVNLGVLFLSFAVCGLGFALAFAFSNPVGFAVDGLGIAFFIYAIFTGEEKKMGQKTQTNEE